MPVESFNFDEEVDGTDHSKYLWGNAAYSFATRLTESFAKHHWCAAIRGVEGGGLVEGLPTHTFKTDEGDVALKCPTEIAITDRREKELSDLGLHPAGPLQEHRLRGLLRRPVVPEAQAVQHATRPTPTPGCRPSSSTSWPRSRFAHYLKSMMRDKIGSFMSRSDCEMFLNTWIAEYITTDPEASQELKAKRPLAEARIDVVDVAGKPGCYKAVAFLKPHFQLDELTVSLRLVAELPPPAK